MIGLKTNEPPHEKRGLQGFLPGLTQIGLCSYRKWLEARNLGFKKKRDCTAQSLHSRSAPLFSRRQKSSFLMTRHKSVSPYNLQLQDN